MKIPLKKRKKDDLVTGQILEQGHSRVYYFISSRLLVLWICATMPAAHPCHIIEFRGQKEKKRAIIAEGRTKFPHI